MATSDTPPSLLPGQLHNTGHSAAYARGFLPQLDSGLGSPHGRGPNFDGIMDTIDGLLGRKPKNREEGKAEEVLDDVGEQIEHFREATAPAVEAAKEIKDKALRLAYEEVIQVFIDFWDYYNAASDEERQEVHLQLAFIAFEMIPGVGNVVGLARGVNGLRQEENQTAGNVIADILLYAIPVLGGVGVAIKFWRRFKRISKLRPRGARGARGGRRAERIRNLMSSPGFQARYGEALKGAVSGFVVEAIVQSREENPNYWVAFAQGASGAATGTISSLDQTEKSQLPRQWAMETINSIATRLVKLALTEEKITLENLFFSIPEERITALLSDILTAAYKAGIENASRRWRWNRTFTNSLKQAGPPAIKWVIQTLASRFGGVGEEGNPLEAMQEMIN